MTNDIDLLVKRIREHPDRAHNIGDLAEEFGLPEPKVAREIRDIVKRDGFFDLGSQRVMFTGNSDLAAYEIFRIAAANISYEEFIQYREQPHLLMRLSRDREIACRTNPEKMLQDAVKEKERGNKVS